LLQLVAAVEPAKQKAPAGQGLQSDSLGRPVTALNVPPGHGCAAVAPSSQKDPAGQSKHDDWPLTCMKLPGEHLPQTSMPASGAAEPGLHGSGALAPSRHAWPSGHVVQFACATSPVAPPYVPSAQAAALALTLPTSQ
jgi:hypothetical protein